MALSGATTNILFSRRAASSAGSHILAKGLFVTHRTHICPLPKMEIGGTTISDIDSGARKPSSDLKRCTLHWSFANFSPNVGFSCNLGGKTVNFKTKNIWGPKGPRYIVVEPVAAIKDYVMGGWLDDIYMIGPHQPTERSIIIAPCDAEQIIKTSNYAGEIKYYDPKTSSAEEIYLRMLADKMGVNNLKIYFPRASSLQRLTHQFGEEVAKILLTNPPGIKITAEFSSQEKEAAAPIKFESTEDGYIFTTDTSNLGLGLCSVLAIRSESSLQEVPGETIIASSVFNEEFKLNHILPSTPYLSQAHPSSPFGKLEDAVEAKDEHLISKYLSEIESVLDRQSPAYEKFCEYRNKVITMYGIEKNTIKFG